MGSQGCVEPGVGDGLQSLSTRFLTAGLIVTLKEEPWYTGQSNKRVMDLDAVPAQGEQRASDTVQIFKEQIGSCGEVALQRCGP